MTEKLADSDIDQFIREQKNRLALEKREMDAEVEYQRTTRRRWAEPDKENIDFYDKKEPDTRADLRRPETPARQGYPVDNRQVIKQRKQLSEQRKLEYNAYLKSHTNNRRKPRNLTPTQKSIQVGNPNDRTKEILNTERRNDYNEYLNREKRKPRKFPGRKTPLPETRRVPYEPRPQERKFYDPQLKYSDEMPQNVDLRLRLELDSSDEYYPVETETPKAASLPIGQYEIQRRKQAPEIKRRYRADLEKQLREKEQINRNRSGNKQRLDYGKARQDAFKRQMRVQGSPRKSAEKFDDMRRPPADYRNIKTYTEYNNSQSKYTFRNQYDYEQWQKKQLAALNSIERRQQELRHKLERDQTIRELERDLLPQDDCEVDIQTQRLLEKNRSPSPHVDPPLYDPIDAEELRQSARESPERLLIPDNLSKERADKLRRERQQDYQDMMAQKQSSPRRLFDQEDQQGWGIFGEGNYLESLKKPKTPKPAVITSPQNQQNKENMRNQQNGGMKSQGSGRRMWKEDSSLDFFSSNRPEQRRVPADKFNEFTKGSRRTPAEQNGYVPSQMQNKPKAEPMPVGGHRVDEERRQEYQEMLKSKSTPRNRRYNENETDEFMSNKYDKPKVQGKGDLDDFIKSGPSPRAAPSNQSPVQSQPSYRNQHPDMERKEEYNNLIKNSSKPKKLYKEPSKDDFFDFDRIQRNNPSVKQPRERAPVDEEMKREYNENIKNNPKPILKPYRENSSDDFLKYGGPQRRVNNNSTRVPTSETFHNQEKEYQAKVKGGQTPRRRTWREPTNDNFFETTDKYQQAPKKFSSGSDIL
ncbi:hypothetical protein LOTGIDRAFT_234697 [Lottia gigantea]|uniref:CCDC66 domain-containing protein n=1 Tax=Lottia gigantea TaxID=225164 RepID=V4A4E3_LOTGI|nr:hypothetical protein LOTGIDRAFT_234697 [Lottia gigantea]ESO88126.1 hypothetical protein LOTGIDRAFT_234697 [Lottia gigantea]